MASQKTTKISPRTLETALSNLLTGNSNMDDDEMLDQISDVSTFEDAGVMTRDRGLVVRFQSGLEIQVSLVVSRRENDWDWEDSDDEDDDEDD